MNYIWDSCLHEHCICLSCSYLVIRTIFIKQEVDEVLWAAINIQGDDQARQAHTNHVRAVERVPYAFLGIHHNLGHPKGVEEKDDDFQVVGQEVDEEKEEEKDGVETGV